MVLHERLCKTDRLGTGGRYLVLYGCQRSYGQQYKKPINLLTSGFIGFIIPINQNPVNR